MITYETMRLTAKYLSEYTEYCKQNVCGVGCPVFDEHEKHKEISCFMTYCNLRESGKLPAPN